MLTENGGRTAQSHSSSLSQLTSLFKKLFDQFVNLFDTQVAYRHVAIPLAKVRKLDAKSYLPGGNTALNDAIGITVRKIDADRPRVDKVVTVIMTDGEENSSREWTHDAVKALISQKESEGTWTFVFLGASPEAWDQGRGYGIPAANVAQYDVNHYRHVCLYGEGHERPGGKRRTQGDKPVCVSLENHTGEGGPPSGIRKKLRIGSASVPAAGVAGVTPATLKFVPHQDGGRKTALLLHPRPQHQLLRRRHHARANE